MALSVKVGAYTTPAGTGTDAQTGMGFAPKAMFFLHPLRTSAGTAARAIFHVGYVDDSDTTSHSVEGGWQSDDAVGTSYVIRSMRTSRNWAIPVAGSAATFTLDGYIQSLDADGYTPNFITTSSGYQTPYLAIGGTDITNTYSGTFQLNSTTGNQSVTAPGFQPDIVFFQINSQASASLTAGDAEYSFGVAKSSSARWASAVSSDHGAATSQTQRAFYNNHCLVGINAASAAISHSADFVSMDTNGFTINVDTADGSNHTCNYIAIKGGQWAVGDTTLNTSTGNQDVTTTGIDPAAIILSTANHTTANSITDNARISAGFGTSSTSRQSIWAGDSDNQDTTITDQAYATDGVILDYTEGTPTLNAKADITSLGTAKFTLNVTTAGSAINFGYVALGTTSASTLSVNESESISVTESVNTTVSDPQVNESESITLTDTPIIRLENNVIESENITVSENAAIQLENYIQESETVTVSENVAVEVSSPQPSVSDTITVSENSSVFLPYIAPVVSDSITVSEAILVSVQNPPNIEVAVMDSPTVTDIPNLVVDGTQINETESVTVTDTPVVRLENNIVESENITVSDNAVLAVSDPQINEAENITVSENVQVSICNEVTFGKLTDGTQSTSSSADRKKVSSFTPTSSGTAKRIVGRLWLSATGSTNVKGVIYADSSGVPGALLAVSDEVNITHTTEQEVIMPLSGGNQISIASGTPYWVGWHHQDPGVPSVSISRDATASQSQTNTDTYSDGPTDPFGTPTAEAGPIDVYVVYCESGLAVNVSDSITISENIITTISDPQIVEVESITVLDTPAMRLESYINESESVTVTENVSVSNPTDYASASDNVSVTENVNIVIVSAGELQVAEQESITVTENIAVIISDPQVNESESITITDTPTVNLESYITESESISVSESVSVKVSDLQINVSDSITVNEALLVIRQDAEPIQVGSMDSISITENVSVAVPLLEVNETENISVTDTPEVKTELNVVESENITVTDTPNIQISSVSTLEVNVSENISVTDSPQVSNLLLQINVSESIAVSESVSIIIPATYIKPSKYSLDIGGGLSKMIIGADRIAYSSGAPTGNPSGYVLVFDKTNNRLYVYNDDTDTWVAIN